MTSVRHSRVLRTIPLLISVCFFSFPAQAQYGGGTGEPNDPYLIYTAEQMNEIGLHEKNWDKHFKLMKDIDLGSFTGTDFNIIGYYVRWDSPYNKPFTGVFDGTGKKISNFSYTSTDLNGIGLFRYVKGENAPIKDLGLIDANVDAGTGYNVGSLVGYLEDGTITGCYVEGGSVSGEGEVGGLVGWNKDTIVNCYSTGNVSGNEDVGGLVGDNEGTITNCYSACNVTGDQWIGGLVGWLYEGTITGCYSASSVSGEEEVGGLVGDNDWGTITNCYATTSVFGNDHVGGLVGTGGGAIASFWDIETSGQLTSTGGKGRTTAQMQMAGTFLGWGGCGNEGIWMIDEGKDYPRLWWESKPGEALDTQQLSDFLTGAGTEDEPYLIYTAEQINVIGVFPCEWDKYFILMADIDLGAFTGTDFNIIGISYDNAFTGVFDGNGKKISNFSYTSTYANCLGFFGYVADQNAQIKDLGLIDPNIDAGTGDYVGSLIGWLRNGSITACYVEGGIVLGNENIGGLVGAHGEEQRYPVPGYPEPPPFTISNCYSTAIVVGHDSMGGLVGSNYSGPIDNCYAMGSIFGVTRVGGLVGRNYSGTITNCYSTGIVTGTTDVGGLVGQNSNRITYCFWDVETSGQTNSAGGTGKTTAEMQISLRFFGWGGWGNEGNGLWTIDEGNDYPRLWWENAPGDVIEPTPQLLTHATSPRPTDGAIHEDTWANLSWSPGAYAVSHRVYFGDNFDDVNDGTGGTFRSNRTSTSYVVGLPGSAYPDGLVPGTTYYWRIDEVNNMRPESPCKGDVWSFTVPRRIAFNPSLPDGAIHEDTWANLSWKPGDYAVYHDVYFGDNFEDVNQGSEGTFQGNQAGTFLVVGLPGYAYPDGLVPGTTYYWRIDEVNDMHSGSPWKGNIWSFMISPYTAYNPTPPDGAKFVDPNISLSWTAGLGAKLHTVYFGDDFDAVNNAVGNLPQETTTYDPGPLKLAKTYYWRVDELDGVFTHKSDVWSFTVPHRVTYNPYPPDGAIHEDTWANLSWSPGAYAVSHEVYFGDNFDDVNDGTGGTFRGNRTSTSYVVGLPGFAYPDGLELSTTYYWRIDDVNNIHPESPCKGDVWSFTVLHSIAFNPSPPDGALHEDTWANLSWRPGDYAVSHDVYFGDNFEDINQGTEDTFQNNQVSTSFIVGFPGFAYPDGLVPGTTYYWRIDEVNDTEPNSPWKGDIWSFWIPPYTAYNPTPSDGAESVELDASLSWTPGFGAKLHYVYFGETFDEVDNAAGGLPQGDVTYDPWLLELAKTYYWRVDEFDAVSTYKGDVWSFITKGAVGRPEPANGAVDVTQIPILTWTHGIYAASHQVYFGTNKETVKNADTSSPEYKGSDNLGSESYDPGMLEWDATYYWRIDEVNNVNPDSPWTGPVWSFTTANFLIVDDFESYNDLDPFEPESNRIFETWMDGYDIPTNGSLVGPFSMWVDIWSLPHSGKQSMPFYYDNSVGKSEATMTLRYPRDWTENGVSTLSIWFRGDSANAAEPMYVVLNGTAGIDNDNPNAAQVTTWTEWTIDLQRFADQGVDLTNINTISIGFGYKDNPVAGGSGTMYFDDIRLYRPVPQEP